MLTRRPSSSSSLATTPRASGGAPTAAAFIPRPRARGCGAARPGAVGVVPGRDPGLEVARLPVARGVLGDPVERGVQKRELVRETGVGVVAELRVAEPAVLHQLVPAVARPRKLDRHASTVGRDPHHVSAPRARLGEHLERELLVVGPVAPCNEPELQEHYGHDHDPSRDDPQRRLHSSKPTSTAAGGTVFGSESTTRKSWFQSSAAAKCERPRRAPADGDRTRGCRPPLPR